MAFTLSPGVSIVEKDLTNVVPAVSTSAGAFAGPFAWGPVLDPVLTPGERVNAIISFLMVKLNSYVKQLTDIELFINLLFSPVEQLDLIIGQEIWIRLIW
jgi:hypothetical protein